MADGYPEDVRMPPAHPTRRPRPHRQDPGHPPVPRRPVSRGDRAAAVAAARTASLAGEPIKAPGIGAFLRRHPQVGPRSAIAAIAGGIALFVTATATTSPASANSANPPAARAPIEMPAPPLAPQLSIDSSAVTVRKVLNRAPEH